jgi:hypothetical protein
LFAADVAPLIKVSMQAHAHDHHRGRPEISPSLLRLSALQRIAIAALLSALLWGAVLWAIA